jgi:hypothetical protein
MGEVRNTQRVNMRYLILISVACISTAILNAQDSHYWTNQYGTQSWLLGGAVVGSTTDLSSTYYNPGALALYPDTSAVQSAITLNWTRSTITTTNTDFRLRSGNAEPLPTLVAVNLPIQLFGSRSLVVSYLKRTDVSLDLDGSLTDRLSETSVLSVSGAIVRDLNDSWFGLTWSRNLDHVHAFGVTTYISTVSSEYSSLISSATVDNGRASSASLTEYESYGTARLLAKLGYYYDGRPLSIGVTVTTPALHLLTTRGETRISQFVQLGDSMTTFYGDKQKGLSADYRTPLSIAVGATWRSEATSVYFTAEWFSGLNAYRPLVPAPFQSIIPDTMFTYGEVINRYAIINVAVGMKTKISDRTSFYLSLIRDGSYLRAVDTESNSIVNYDLYHGTIGWNFAIDPLEITVGGIIGGGYIDAAPPSEYAEFINLPPGTRVNRQLLRIGAILGIVAKL